MVKLIYNAIADETEKVFSYDKWLEHHQGVWNALLRYQPDKPKDGTSGFLAYNVGDDKPRMKIKTGRFLTKKLNLNNFLNCQSIQNIANRINMQLFDCDITIELVNGKKITGNYRDGIGGSSCMTGDCAEYTKMYEQNPDRFLQLIMKHCNGSARAMVHKLDNGKFLMDRIYTDNNLQEAMINYAIKQGWFYRYSNCASDYEIFFGDNAVDDYSQFIVSGLNWDDGEVPYQDTLIHYEICDDGLTISHSESELGYDGTLDQTNGYIGESFYCDSCRETYHNSDFYTTGEGSILCSDCFNENYSYCENCDETYHNEEMVLIEDKDIWVCRSCADNIFYYCENCDQYNGQHITETVDGDTLCDACLLEKYSYCESCNEWVLSEKIGHDGFCKHCVENRHPIPAQNENNTGKLPFKESVQNAIIE